MVKLKSMISIIVPVFNEQDSLSLFYKELVREVKGFAKNYEIVFIDDGSFDNSLAVLTHIAVKDSHVRIFSFRKNQGKAEALTFGFQKAKGEYIVTLDADLQDKPSEIYKLLDKAKNGWDVVSGWRKNRQDSIQKILASKIFNFLAGIFWGLNLHDYNCGLKVYTQDAAKSIFLYGGMHRFIPILAYEKGFTVTEEVVAHDIRKFGKSKYGFSKVFKDLPDMFTMLFLTRYGKRPLHFFGSIGFLLFFTGFLIFAYLSTLWFLGESIGRRPLLLFSILLLLAGLQVFFTGFLADLLINATNTLRFGHKEHDDVFLLKYAHDE